MAIDEGRAEELLRRAGEGDESALAELFDAHRERLRQMVRLRLDPRLQRRVDPSDVLQEAYLDAASQLPGYLARPEMPHFLWLRRLTGLRLIRLHRQHLGAAMRSAGREVPVFRATSPEASSLSMAEGLVGRFATASQEAIRVEQQLRIRELLDRMDEVDREVIALRHFEELSNGEVAEVLGLSKTAASNRYVRAIARLQELLERSPGALDPPS